VSHPQRYRSALADALLAHARAAAGNRAGRRARQAPS